MSRERGLSNACAIILLVRQADKLITKGDYMIIPRERQDKYLTDIQVILDKNGIDIAKQDHGKTGLKAMWQLFHEVEFQRTQNDMHPAFVGGKSRYLPQEVNRVSLYSEFNCNDSHIETMLKQIKNRIM